MTLVTGAAGFLGRHLVRRLVQAGVTVRASDRSKEAPADLVAQKVEYVPADVTSPQTLAPLFLGVDRVFHLAAICNFSTPLAKLFGVNVEGPERVGRLALQQGVSRFVHVSSTSVYGLGGAAAFTEDSPLRPVDDYGRSKRGGEEALWGLARQGLPLTVLRPCTVYGPGCTDGAGKVFSRPSRVSAVPGRGDKRLSNVRVEDVAEAAAHLCELPEANGRAYNLADDSHPTLAEALRWAAEAFGTRPPARHVPLALAHFAARLGELASRFSGRIADVEPDALAYLAQDYLVDNARLKATGFRLTYPDFRASVAQLGRRFQGGAP